MNIIRTVVLLLAASPAARGDHSHLRNLKKEKVCKALDGTQDYNPVDYPADELDSRAGCGIFVDEYTAADIAEFCAALDEGACNSNDDKCAWDAESDPDEPVCTSVIYQSCFPKSCTGNFNILSATLPVREQTGQGFVALAAWVEGVQDETLLCLDPKGYHFTFAPPTVDDPVQRIKVFGHILLFIYPPVYGIGPGAADKISVPGVWWMQGGTISLDAENCVLVGPPDEATWECDDGVFTKAEGKFIDVCEYFEHGIMDHCMHQTDEGECTSDDLCAWDDDQSGCYPDIHPDI